MTMTWPTERRWNIWWTSTTNKLALNVAKIKKLIVDFRRPAQSYTTPHQRYSSGESKQHQVPGGADKGHSNLVPSHRSSCKESSAAHALSAPDEESTPPPSNPQYLLQRLCEEHTDQLQLRLVWSLQCLRQEVPTVGDEDSGEDYRDFTCSHLGHCQKTLPDQGSEHPQRHLPCPLWTILVAGLWKEAAQPPDQNRQVPSQFSSQTP